MSAPSDTEASAWPALPLADWDATKRTLHRYTQVVGKVRAVLVPYRNHWWHTTLYLDTRGLTTGPMAARDGRSVAIAFDFVDSRLEVADSDGARRGFPLVDGLTCADFYGQVFAALAYLGLSPQIDPTPADPGGPLLSVDRSHRTYDPDAVRRFWKVLRLTGAVLERFAGWFNGKQSPVQLFSHSFDLAQARYSGRRFPPPPGADPVTADTASHEHIAFGFWPGDDRVGHPSYYSYTAPAPAGLEAQPLHPAGAVWLPDEGSIHLPYQVVRTAADPEAALLTFLASAYAAGARAGGWDVGAFATPAAPPA